MGELHLAFSGRSELRKLCVIKTILTHLADEEYTTRFVDEAKVVVKLSHGNLIPVLEAGKVEGEVFLAMEYVDGKDLRDVWLRCVEHGRTFPLDVAVYIVREICRGLNYVHTYGDLHLVHRDVSPPNVLLSYTGEVRLTDFGVATSTIKLQKTAPGILLGKLSYMSPEQARNEPVDARADIFSLGVILWELITGKRLLPPEGDLGERYEQAIDPTFKPPSEHAANVPADLDLIAARALAADRDKRFANAEQMRRELSQLLGKLSPAMDGSAVQTLLSELYGKDRDIEREELRKQLDSMADRVKELVRESGLLRRSPSPEETKPIGTDDAGLVAVDADESEFGDFDDFEDDDLLTDAPYLKPGTLLAKRYRVEELLGEGGMGRVYLATHAEIGKKVAVKVLHPSYGRMPDLVSRFRREARAATKIGHPHIVEVYDSGKTADGSIYFVMEYLTGIDLADVLSTEGRLGVERAIRIGIQICEAVSTAHEAGIIHRDLKPENIYLTTREGTPDFVKVLDFGLAQSTGREESRKERLTNPGMAMGTPEYMAPEQAAGKKTDHRADVYAVGTLLYEMLVGTPPHMGDNIMEVFNRKAVEPVVPPREHRKAIPVALERVVLWALEYAAENRPQTMAQLSYELTKLAHGRAGAVASLLGIPATVTDSGPALAIQPDEEQEEFAVEGYTAHLPSKKEEQPRSRRWVVAAIAGGALLAVAGGLYLKFGPNEGTKVAGATPRSDMEVAVDPPDAAATAAAAVDPDGGVSADALAPDTHRAAPATDPRPATRTPRHPARHSQLYLGRRHLLAGRFNEARQAFQIAMRKRRYRGRAELGIAEVEFQLGRFHVAEKFAQEAVKHGAGWRARLVLANIHYRLRDYRRAIKLYERVLKHRPQNPEARRNLAAAKRRLNQ
jgi:serine/threonine protein kinase